LSRVHPSDKRSSYLEMVRHVKGETPMFEHEYRLRVADDTYKWIFTRGKVVERAADGKAELMLGVYTDITDRKKNEIIVIRQQAALHALIEIAATPVVNAEEQLLRALAVGSRYLGLPVGIVSQVIGNQYHVKFQHGASTKSPVSSSAREREKSLLDAAKSTNLNTSIAVDVLHNRLCERPYRTEDVFAEDDINNSEYATHPGHVHGQIDSYIGVPIWLKGEIYGTLCFMSERSRHQHYDELDKDFVQLMARWVGIKIERWQHEVEQQALLDRFDKLCNQLPGFLYQFQLRPDGSSFCPYASAGIEELYGVRAEEVMESAEKLFSVLHPDDLGWITETVAYSSSQLIPWIATFRVLNPKRGEIWVHAESRPERIADGSILWHGFIVDITEEKQAEIKLQEVNALREAIFDAASISIISTDTHGII
ncbi:MAG: PAS domain S-box protein, partial [Moraxellaceae bacterium]